MDCSKLPFFNDFLLFFLCFFLCLNMVTCTKPQFRYSDHCNSVVRESNPVVEDFTVSPFSVRQNGYYSGGDEILNRTFDSNYPPESKVLVFETHHVYSTDVEDVFMMEGNLIFQTSYYNEQSFSPSWSSISYSSVSSERGALDFDFQGFWSRKTGELCMVGSSYTYSKEGKPLHLAAVLKFNDLKDSSTINTLVIGTMDSLYSSDKQNYFKRISLLMFPQVNYKYGKVSQGCHGGTDVPEKSSLSLLRTRTICDMFSGEANTFQLDYASGCDSSKSCNPFGDVIGYLPPFMSWSVIHCSEDKQSLRFLIKFRNNSYMGYYPSTNFSTSLVGEGSWDVKKNRLCIVACRILDASSSFEKSHVGDCTTWLSLRFPAVLSIRNTSVAVGEIWSEKFGNKSGFFDRIAIRNAGRDWGGIQLQGLKYEYTETDKVKKYCLKKKSTKNSREGYPSPNGYSRDMSFHMSITNHSKQNIGWGSSVPLAVGDQPNQRFPSLIPSSSSWPQNSGVESNDNSSFINISYKMKLEVSLNPFNQSLNGYQEIQISAEGVYDAETGNLCMIGCKDLRSDNKASLNHSMDCEILVNIQFPPLNTYRKRGYVMGSIESLRKNTDNLHFESLHFSGRAYYQVWREESNWRMDFEIIVSVISNTLAIVFVALQIFHVRKHRGTAGPFVSLLMLVILALGHLIPLVLNLEAMFAQDSQRSVWIRSGIWLEMNEVIIRVVTMVAFLLEIRLLILSWNARCSTEKHKVLWSTEKRGLYVCVPTYLAGALIAFFVKWKNQIVRTYYRDREQILLGGSRAYAGLILDAFLFPQIIFNMFHNSKEQALSRFFFIGITIVRLVPHGYDLYRAHNYVDIDGSYIYGDPTTDYYSTAWDLIIPILGVSFAAIIHFQQKLGGRFFLPKRFQESVKYQELQMASEDDQLATKI